MRNVKISIAMVTYNHQYYIEKAINSVLEQDLDIDFEIIVGDDCSTDDTSKILEDLKNQYPDKIELILRDRNIGATKNFYEVIKKCQGDYIAILEGDDYWTDTSKLQQQVNFLSENPSYIGCTHRYGVVDDQENLLSAEYFGPGRPSLGEYNIEHFEKYVYPGHIGTLVFRNIFKNSDKDLSILYRAHNLVGDITLYAILISFGNIYVMDKNMLMYRSVRKKNGSNYVSIISGKNKMMDRYNYLKYLEKHCSSELNLNIVHKDRLDYYIWWSILFAIKYPTRENIFTLKEFVKLETNKVKLIWNIFKNCFTIPLIFYDWVKNKLIRIWAKNC